MSRAIRLRAWDKQKGQYADPKLLALLLDGTLGFNTRQGVYPIPDTGQPDLGRDCYVVEQWTGLTDKDGKDIYEGDILSWEPDEAKRLALWNEGEGTGDLAIAQWSEEHAAWIGFIQSRYGGEGFEHLVAPGYREQWIVLGNTHENPDLLAAAPAQQ